MLVEATGLEPTTLGPSSQHALIVSLCLRQRRRLYGRLLLSPKKRYSFYSGTPYMVRGARGHGQPRHSATQQKKTGQNPIFFVGAGVHKGFNKHTGTYNHISKSAHFLIILFCGTKYLQKVRDEKTGEILRYLPFFGI